MEGAVRGGDLTTEDVETFEPGKPVECLLVGIASEPDVGDIARSHYVQFLLRGVRREAEQLGRKGVILTKIYATSDTPTGIATAIHIGMDEYSPKAGKRLRFVLDVEKSQSFLLDDYKKGLAEWRKSQEEGGKEKRSSISKKLPKSKE